MLNYQRVNVNGSRTRISVDMLHSYAGEGAWRRVDADAHQDLPKSPDKVIDASTGCEGRDIMGYHVHGPYMEWMVHIN